MFTALGFIYSKDCTEPKERREVLRVLTCLHLAYNVQFHPLLAQAWKKYVLSASQACLYEPRGHVLYLVTPSADWKVVPRPPCWNGSSVCHPCSG